MHNRRVPRGLIGLLVILVLLLAGCVHIRQEVTLMPDEEWKADVKITFPASTVEQLGEEMMQDQDADFEEQTAEAERRGVHAEMEMRTEGNGDVVYSMKLEGSGYDLLNEFVFDSQATFSDAGDGKVQVNYDAGDMTAFAEMGGSYTLVFNAGQIHSSNATKTSGGTATWENPAEPIQIELTPGSPPAAGGFPWLIVILVIIGIVVVAVVVIGLLYLRGRRISQPGQ